MTVRRPLDIPDREFFLGFGLIDVVETNDGGTGPRLTSSRFQRELSTKQLKHLAQVAGKDGTGLRTRDHEHALCIAIPQAFVNEDSLTKSLSGPFQRLRWLPGATNETMVLIAGSHRQKISQELTKKHLSEIKKYESQLERANETGNEPRQAAIQAKIDGLRSAMEPKAVWLAMIYTGKSSRFIVHVYLPNGTHREAHGPRERECNGTLQAHDQQPPSTCPIIRG